MGACSQRFGQVPALADAAVADDAHELVVLLVQLSDLVAHVEHCAPLGDPNASDDAGGADRSSPLPYFECVGPLVLEVHCCFLRSNIAQHNLGLVVVVADPSFHSVQHFDDIA